MKVSFNITTYSEDLDRYADSADLQQAIDRMGFDGVELMYCGPDDRSVVQPGQVIGLHMGYFTSWLDFWRQDEQALLAEFDTLDNVQQVFGGLGRSALVDRFRADLAHARDYGAEYVVFHVSEVLTRELTTFSYRATDEEVVEAACEVLNEVFSGADGRCFGARAQDAPWLLLENLWQPGLNFADPSLAADLLRGIEYPRTGFMFDTGHALHRDFSLRTQEDGVAYLNRLIDRLDAHGGIMPNVRGVHLNQSMTGAYCQRLQRNPVALPDAYWDRWAKAFSYAFRIDEHRPFTCKGVDALVGRLAPDFLTFEFISESRSQHDCMLEAQWAALLGVRALRAPLRPDAAQGGSRES